MGYQKKQWYLTQHPSYRFNFIPVSYHINSSAEANKLSDTAYEAQRYSHASLSMRFSNKLFVLSFNFFEVSPNIGQKLLNMIQFKGVVLVVDSISLDRVLD